MAFYLDADAVSGVGEDISGIAKNWKSVESTAEGMDTTHEGTFDIEGAKSAITNNLKGAGIKFTNTASLLDAVVKVHGGTQDTVGGGADTSSYGGCASYSSGCGSSPVGCGGCASSPSYNPSPSYISDTTSSVAGVTTSVTALDAIHQLSGETGATTAIGLETLTKVDDVLAKIDVKEIEVSNIEKETKGKNTIIIEGISSSTECANYLTDVAEVSKKYDVSVKYVRLDKIIEDPKEATNKLKSTASSLVNTTKEKIIDIYNSVKNHRRAYTMQYSDDWCAGFVSSVLIKSGYENYTNILDPGVGKMCDGFKENKMYIEAKKDTIPESGSVIFYRDTDGVLSHVGIVESVDKNGVIHTIEGNYDGSKVVRVSEAKVGGSNIAGYGVLKKSNNQSDEEKIIDEASYKKLTELNTTDSIKLKDTPITLIIKDDKVVNSLQGVVSKITLEAAIKAAGIPEKLVLL